MTDNPDNKVQSPDFDSIKQISPYGAEFWSARDLMPLLGYQRWENFNVAIKRAMTAFQQSGNKVEDHFRGVTKLVGIGSRAKRNVKDYLLSRFACFLIAENGDPEKPEIATAQLYFAIATREYELKRLAEEQASRLELRERIAEGNKDLAKAATGAGVLPRNFGTFQNAGYAGLYGGLNVEQIKSRKGIKPKEDLLDRAGLAELGANALRIGLIEQRLRTEKSSMDEAKAIGTHRSIGKNIRDAIEKSGSLMPEDLPAEPSIKPLLDQKKRARQKAAPAPGQVKMFDDNSENNRDKSNTAS